MDNEKPNEKPETRDHGLKMYLVFALLIGGAVFGLRILTQMELHQSALLYIGMPFILSLLLLFLTPRADVQKSWLAFHWNWLRASLIVLLATSIIIQEGFICVLMFIPIWLAIWLIAVLCGAINATVRKKQANQIHSIILPTLVLMLSLEGTLPTLTLEREAQAANSLIVDLSIEDIKANMVKPIHLGEQRPWLMALFPMPYDVKANSLNQGDIHELHYRYHRWFITNTHEGTALLQLKSVTDKQITTQYLQDTSYIANYLTLHGTQIDFEPITPNQTKVSLAINYSRDLDPAWYFGPLQQLALEQTAGYLIKKVMARDANTTPALR